MLSVRVVAPGSRALAARLATVSVNVVGRRDTVNGRRRLTGDGARGLKCDGGAFHPPESADLLTSPPRPGCAVPFLMVLRAGSILATLGMRVSNRKTAFE